jgi:hypothetical protein
MTIVAALSAVTVALACNDKKFLTEQPFDFIGPTNFYHNSGDALAAINGVYADFINSTGDDYYGRNFVMLAEHTTEMWTSRLSATNERSQPDVYAIPLSHAYVQSVWSAAFDAVNRANSVLDHVPTIDMDTTLRNRIIGEAKFLRATHYFNLVRMFGGVPLKLHETLASTAFASAQHGAGSVRADRAGSERTRSLAAVSQVVHRCGRRPRSRGAAKTLLAKVYLQRAGTASDQPPIGRAHWRRRSRCSRTATTRSSRLQTLFDFIGGTINERNSEVIFAIENIRARARRPNRLARRSQRHGPFLGASHNGSFEAESIWFASFRADDKRRDGPFVFRGIATDDRELRAEQCRDVALRERDAVPAKVSRSSHDGTGAEEPNYIVLRYAEVLLMIAERRTK